MEPLLEIISRGNMALSLLSLWSAFILLMICLPLLGIASLKESMVGTATFILISIILVGVSQPTDISLNRAQLESRLCATTDYEEEVRHMYPGEDWDYR